MQRAKSRLKDSKIKVWDKSVLIIVVAICFIWIVNIIWGGGNKYWIALTGGGAFIDE